MYYLALIFRDDVGGYGFTVPDIPGFTADAEGSEDNPISLADAIAVARRVLADHLAALVDAGLPIPEARAPEEVIADPEMQEDLAGAMSTILLAAVLPAGRTMRINITMDENTLDLVDQAAAERNLTRSAFIAEACRRFATSGGGELSVKASGAVAVDDVERAILVGALENVSRRILAGGVLAGGVDFTDKAGIDWNDAVAAAEAAPVGSREENASTGRRAKVALKRHPRTGEFERVHVRKSAKAEQA